MKYIPMISQTYPDKNVKHDKKIYGTLKKQQSVNIHIKFQEKHEEKENGYILDSKCNTTKRDISSLAPNARHLQE